MLRPLPLQWELVDNSTSTTGATLSSWASWGAQPSHPTWHLGSTMPRHCRHSSTPSAGWLGPEARSVPEHGSAGWHLVRQKVSEGCSVKMYCWESGTQRCVHVRLKSFQVDKLPLHPGSKTKAISQCLCLMLSGDELTSDTYFFVTSPF